MAMFYDVNFGGLFIGQYKHNVESNNAVKLTIAICLRLNHNMAELL